MPRTPNNSAVLRRQLEDYEVQQGGSSAEKMADVECAASAPLGGDLLAERVVSPVQIPQDGAAACCRGPSPADFFHGHAQIYKTGRQ